MALAYEWVARIFAVSLLMFLPGVAGQWLDARFETEFLTLVGFAFGFCAGFATLLIMVNGNKKSNATSAATDNDTDQNNHHRER